MSRLTLPSRRLANLALYGTITLCTGVTYLQLTTSSTLRTALSKSDHKTAQQALSARTLLNNEFTCSLRNLQEGRYYTLATSAWNHGSLTHYLGNMLGLWSFGRTIAHQFGARAFLGLFYGGALTGNLACLGLDRYSGALTSSSSSSSSKSQRHLGEAGRNYVGASGGVCAISCATACLNPFATVFVMIAFVPVPIPSFMFPVGFAGFSAWAQTNGFQGNVAHLGHLGGLAYGFLWFVGRGRGLGMGRVGR